MRVLVADSIEQSGLDALKSMGCEVLDQPNLTDQLLADAVRDLQADVLVVRSTQVLAGVFAAPSLKLVVRAGAGYNTIDVVAASKRGVYVANCPGQNSVAVSELAFGLILALDRRIADSLISLRAECGIKRNSPKPAVCTVARWGSSAWGELPNKCFRVRQRLACPSSPGAEI